MNSKDPQDSTRENQTSPQKHKVLLLGIAGTLVTAVVVAVTACAQADQTPQTSRELTSPTPRPTIQSQIRQGVMNRGMMSDSDEWADLHFIEMMIPHHEGAVQMADLALKLSKRPEIKKLAESIKSSQTNEIKQMKSWYKQWYGVEVPDFVTNYRGRRGYGRMMGWRNSMGMQNMMAVDLKALETAPDFDKAFIEEMIPHHKMALMMSNMIVDSDRSEMRTLSTAIVKAQSSEIEQMRQWYQTWYK